MNLDEMFKQDASDVTASSDDLSEVSKLAEIQLLQERTVIELERALAEAKDNLRNTQEYLLPNAMAQVGMSEFKLTNGQKITIKDDVYASIKKDYVTEAVSWLDANGLGDVVKDKVDINFGRGESDQARGLLEYCRKLGYNASETLSVHPQTLKALVKEQMSHGVQFPEEFFSVAPVQKAIIKNK